MNCKSLIWTLFLLILGAEAMGLENRPIMRRACLNRLDSTLDILWFKPSDNCGSFSDFSLYGRDNVLGVFQLLARSNNYSINSISIKLPNLKSWEFFLVYNKTCDGTDSLFSDTIGIDNSPPINSEIDSVSVDLASQKTLIGWKQNASNDVKGYLIYHVTGLNTIIADTASTFYHDRGNRNPANAPVNYSIAAYDSCNNASLISPAHSTIHLRSNYDQCNKSINLQWTAYVGWPANAYQIFRKINTGSYELVGSVVANINQFTYTFQQFGDNYCFFVRAIRQGGPGSSSSNTVCESTAGIVASRNSYIAKASVQNNEVELSLVTENGTSLQKINIYKGINNGNLVLWNSLPFSGGILELKDPDVNVQLYPYEYFFTTEGPCNLIFDSSQRSKTIVLQAIMLQPGDQQLSWSLYSDFIKSTQKQELLLSDNPNFNKSSPWNILNTFTPGVISSNDNTNFGINQEQICYCIRAIENNPSAPYNRRDTSYSNIRCLTADPVVFFPNAMHINGYNNTFYPKGTFIDYEKSSFQVYNRWGEIIYETNDIRKAWDGSFNGEYVESDVYAYRAIVVGINGKELYFDGTITVLK